MEKKYEIFVGIDISKLKLDITILDASNKSEHFEIKNTAKGIKGMISHLKRRKMDLAKVLFTCENTGVYANPVTSYLSNEGLDCWVVSALEIKRSKGITRGKTDKSDSKDIALYSKRQIDKLSLYKMADDAMSELKNLQAQREKILRGKTKVNHLAYKKLKTLLHIWELWQL